MTGMVKRIKVVNGVPLDRRWTDPLVVIGPNLRWTQDDFEDLARERPEVLLGYSIWLMPIAAIAQGHARGMRPVKVIELDYSLDMVRTGDLTQALPTLRYWRSQGATFETWHVHRVLGIWRIGA